MVAITDAANLIREIEELGGRLKTSDGLVHIVAPKRYYDQIEAHVRANKPAIIAALNSRCRRCPSFGWIEVPIHGGRSIRLDCSCGAFIDFVQWEPERDDRPSQP